MAKITAGNALYLYRLLGRELGVGKQTSMARVTEVLEADGIWPEDLGCADVRALCEALTDFAKVTAFKKGQVFVTVMRSEELDRMLERAGEPTAAEKAASKGKPWKHRKGAKAVKPQKPRHVEKPVAEPAAEPAPESVPEPATEPVAEEEPQAEAAMEKTAEAEVTGDAPETVGLEGLSRRVEGAWRAFASDEDAAAATSPEDELARYAVLGSWDRLLADLAGAAEAENWGTDLHVLKDFLTMAFHRERLQGRLAVTDDGSSAAFDTGLLSPEGEPICAVLEPRDGDIAWELACFSTNACARAASYGEAPSVQTVIDALLAANTMDLRRLAQRLARNPRTMTLAYDAVANEVRVLLPGKNDALVVDLSGNAAQVTGHISLEDAYSCARVVSSDQPGWLAAGLG